MSQAVLNRSDEHPITTPAPVAVEPRSRNLRALRAAAHYLPTVLVLVLLTGLGIYGHRMDWKLPKFATIVSSEPVDRDDWCEEHAVPESQCVNCRSDLLPAAKDYEWCQEHGVHNCPLHHPDVAQSKETPSALPADLERATRAMAMTDRAENNSVCKNYRRRIQFASLEAVKKVGLDVSLVNRQPIVESIAANGQITYDQSRIANLTSRVPGTVYRVEKSIGDQVQAGEILALIDAADVGRAKTDLMQALVDERLQHTAVTRLASLSGQGVVPGRKAQEAEAAHAQARARVLSAQQTLVNLGLPIDVGPLRDLAEDDLVRRLRLLGLPEPLVQQLGPTELTGNTLPIRSALSGVVVARQVVTGDVVDASRVLFQLADTSRMWLTLNVSVEDAGKLALGQPVRFRPDGSRGEINGKLMWISTTADQQTRMVTVRAELPNPKGQLRNETFGAGKVVLREEQEAIVVPNEAVHWEGDCYVVFVRDKGFFDNPESPKVFHVRTVRIGPRNGEFTEIIAGVLPGEVVAAKGSDVLRAELLKNSLGEGCCAVE
ncbi:MAG: efflux RND transporter periplasmic adaptor subunit [Pirellulaceae bacterium]